MQICWFVSLIDKLHSTKDVEELGTYMLNVLSMKYNGWGNYFANYFLKDTVTAGEILVLIIHSVNLWIIFLNPPPPPPFRWTVCMHLKIKPCKIHQSLKTMCLYLKIKECYARLTFPLNSWTMVARSVLESSWS